jgi:tetratricopeptide (TPR) repeat protein
MKQFAYLAHCLLAFVLAQQASSAAEAVVLGAVQNIRNEWEHVFYELPESQQGPRLEALLVRSRNLVAQYPRSAEPLIMQALVLCALAGHDGGFSALGHVKRARDVLDKSLELDPQALEGSALVTLGNLYYRLPGWPISFGDDERARQYLEKALKLYPDQLDTNYFYGDFLLDQGEFEKAIPYLEKADKMPLRSETRLSDLKLKQELAQALRDARAKNTARSSFFGNFLAAFSRKTPPK